MAGDPTRFGGDVLIAGTLKLSGDLSLPEGSISANDIESLAGIEATKLQHQHVIHYTQPPGTAIVAATIPLHTFRAAGSTIEVQVVATDAPTGGDKAFTVDVKWASQASPSPASILSAPVSYTNSQANYEERTGNITSVDRTAGDTLVAVIATSGTTGTQGQGLSLDVTVREGAD